MRTSQIKCVAGYVKEKTLTIFLFLFLLGFFTHFSKITVLRTGSGWLPNSGFSWCMVQLGLFIVMYLEILGWNSPIRGTLMRTQKFLCLVVEASPPPAILLYNTVAWITGESQFTRLINYSTYWRKSIAHLCFMLVYKKCYHVQYMLV